MSAVTCSEQIPLVDPKGGHVTVVTSEKKTTLAIAVPRGRHFKTIVGITLAPAAREQLATALLAKEVAS